MSAILVFETGTESERVELGVGESLLVGRSPEPTQLADLARGGARNIVIASPSVSANHVAVERSAETTTLLDVGSRNGTWLRLPPGDRVAIHSAQPLQIRLATSPTSRVAADGPRDATWVHGDDFHVGVAAAVRAWFDQLGLPVRVTTLRSRPTQASPSVTHALPLVNGFDLQVEPQRTVDAPWVEMLEVLWRYVNSQNAVYSAEEATRDEGMILASPAIRHVHRQVVHAAQRGLRLLLIGPSGAGKDLLARCYHRHSQRSGAFVAKNCAMLGREMLRAELFGAEQGAFTGAVRRIVGAVEACHAGTLFLDEIGEMSSDVQPMLLRFLDRGEYERMGSYDTQRSADARIVSATNKDLRAATIRGEFRDDLWYRLAQQVVEVPPLRDRPDDVEAYLRAHSVGQFDAWTALSASARELVRAHPWIGNFRELATFAIRLPEAASPDAVDAAECRTLLRSISLATRIETPTGSSLPSRDARIDLSTLAGNAATEFASDAGRDIHCWDDVKDYLERYLKPLIFAELSGANTLPSRETASISSLAEAIDADRGTVLKQLNRFFERFKKR